MPVNHNINVRLSGSHQKVTNRTSAQGNISKSTGHSGGNKPFGAKQLARGIRAFRTLDAGSLGLFGGVAGASIAVVQETTKLANKIVDIVLDINMARSGETISIGNIKRVKGYILNPKSFIIEATYGMWLERLRINRQNQTNAYHRELSGNLIVGNQYRNKI